MSDPTSEAVRQPSPTATDADLVAKGDRAASPGPAPAGQNPAPDERARRRPEWQGPGRGATLIRLDDGREWAFPRPRLGLVLARDDGEGLAFRSKVADARFADLYDRYFAAAGADALRSLVELAARMLMANYNLAEPEAFSLLAYYPGDPESEAMLMRLRRHVMGLGADDEEEGEPGPKDQSPDG